MEWIELVNSNDDKVMINMDAVAEVVYNKDTNLTEIINPLIETITVKGDCVIDIKRLLTSHDHYVSRLSR